MSLKRILNLCEKHGFLKLASNNGSSSNEIVAIGPTGVILQENLRAEWFYNMVINRDYSVFPSNHSFKETFEYAKEICQDKLPFGVAEVLEETGEKLGEGSVDFDAYFLKEKKLLLRTTMFVEPSNSVHVFHQWQRQRRMWWRRFSASPGRYLLTDIQNNGDGGQSVEIKAEYLWGQQLIESLVFSTAAHESVDPTDLQLKDGRRKFQAHYISSKISLSCMLLNALCDAYDDSTFKGKTRTLLRLHRKLAPYKISFSVVASKAAMVEELSQLALYLCRKLRTNHISSLLIPGAIRNTLEAQWCQYDQLGVPYTVILHEKTLADGIAQLRSRDTTLKEQVHISNLPTYVEQLFKNY